ncbi:MAG: Fibronectin type III domain-containing protein [Candidatus Amesbacteria bacterium GW2011_GWA2_42_12]|uniref:Fibronectin type III domain-containing protein n=1 Tax=Candidatus Amesbacteria bacterium GW2011_GWA2_42_12 TaxID=1618356 RepID=A0A0G1B4E9_9BACT|nr:MAG: Fibronectin type III domain-containing protein [Candidatus Amesbacteria bacterium GW2011_GWA2_42_12]
MTKKTVLISVVSLTLVVIGLLVGLDLVSKNQNLDKKAASSTGTATFKMTPENPIFWTGTTQSISGVLNLPSPILAYQIVAYLSYTSATSPVGIVTGLNKIIIDEPELSNCPTNSISLDSIAKKYTIIIACGVPPLGIPYSTNGTDKTMFTISLPTNTPGTLTLSIDPDNSKVNSSADATDILAIPTGGNITIQSDTTSPIVISNLSTSNPSLNSLTLNWTSPSDTGPINKASSYEIRYSTSGITSSNWTSATLVTSPPAPANAGTTQSLVVSGLNPATTYYFGIKSKDGNNNQSSLSNVASATTTNKGSLNFQIKFQGVSSAVSGKVVNIALKQGTTQTGNFNNVALTASGNIFSGSIPNIDGGTYDVYLKGPVHLRKKIPAITVSVAGTLNWPTSPPTLLTGDIAVNNFVDATDYSTMLLTFNPILIQNSVSDLNFDNKVDTTDYSLLLLNFNPLVGGD